MAKREISVSEGAQSGSQMFGGSSNVQVTILPRDRARYEYILAEAYDHAVAGGDTHFAVPVVTGYLPTAAFSPDKETRDRQFHVLGGALAGAAAERHMQNRHDDITVSYANTNNLNNTSRATLSIDSAGTARVEITADDPVMRMDCDISPNIPKSTALVRGVALSPLSGEVTVTHEEIAAYLKEIKPSEGRYVEGAKLPDHPALGKYTTLNRWGPESPDVELDVDEDLRTGMTPGQKYAVAAGFCQFVKWAEGKNGVSPRDCDIAGRVPMPDGGREPVVINFNPDEGGFDIRVGEEAEEILAERESGDIENDPR
jgi:hypothetical protein